jgi:hypothetical protein
MHLSMVRAEVPVHLVRAGSAGHREPLVSGGQERSTSANQHRRSQAVHRHDLGRRSSPAQGSPNHLKDLGINHHRIPPRSPNHNAVGERFQGTALQEFYRPAFHRQHLARLADLGAQFQGWLQHYNTRRRNHGDVMRGRTPFAVMEAHIS